MDFRLLLGIIGALGFVLTSSIVQAQVSTDGTANTTVVGTGKDFTITQGTAAGRNLFHSFQRFSVPTGGSATFNLVDTPTITTIFSRVTGGNVSTIDGLIQTRNGSQPVSLFLINPAGILFGPNASLNIGGSFYASTASSFKFADGSEFSATNPRAPPLLAVTVPLGLQMGSIASGSTITNRGNLTVGQDLILEASYLDLQGQLVAGRDLTLKAEDRVQIRDTVADPFMGRAGGNLTVQGNQSIDILALNHPQSQFQSGGNLSLISDGTISGDAHFASGGFQVRSRSGQLTKFTSLFDPIISSTGNVDIAGDYTGASLLIEALGSVRIQGNITIDAPDNISSFLGSDAILGSVPGLIIRSGQTSLVYGGNQNSPPAYTIGTVPTGITLGGAVVVQPFNNEGGVVNLLAGTGDITVGKINATNQTGGDGGTITLTAANGNLTAKDNLLSFSYSDVGDTGNGGAINLSATNGTLMVNRNLDSGSYSDVGDSGNGGAITFSVTNGNLTTDSLIYSSSFSYSGNGGNSQTAGAITLSALNGNLTARGDFFSTTFSQTGNSGPGGAITVSAINGNLITQGGFNSISDSAQGNSSSGGAITLSSINGDLTNNGRLISLATSGTGTGGTGGAIAISSTNGNLINNGELDSLSLSYQGNSTTGGAIALSATNGNLTNNGELYSMSYAPLNSGNSGAIALATTNGDLTNNAAAFAISYSVNGNSGNGGSIALFTENGNVLLNNDLSSFAYAEIGNSGNGGAIALTAKTGNILGDSGTINSFSLAPGGAARAGGAVSLTAQNQISGLQVLTASSSTQSGGVTVKGQSDLAIADTTILTSKQVTIDTPFTGPFSIDVGGRGRSGDVDVTSAGNLSLTNSRIESDTKGTDPAGNISLTSPGIIRFDNSQVASSTSNAGQAGNIALIAGQGIDLGNSSNLSALTTNTGKAGDITLNAPTVTVSGNAEISAATQGSGRGGTITVNAPTAVNLLRQQGTSPVLSVEASGAGQAGDIVINTANLTLADQARITATATATATNAEGGGSITLNASQMNLAGIVGVFAETQGQAPAGTLRLNPYSTDTRLAVNLVPQSQVSVSTSGSGKGGDLILTAPDTIVLTGAGKLTAETTGTGNAGNISLTTQQITLQDGVQLSAATSGSGKGGDLSLTAPRSIALSGGSKLAVETSGSGNAGNISLNTGQLNLTEGSQLSASTSSSGKGGDLTLTVPQSITLSSSSKLVAETSGSDNAGNISLNTGQLSLTESAQLSTSTSGAGNAGNFTLTAATVTLGQAARISSSTSDRGRAGDIRLSVSDQLTLRSAGLLATTAPGSTGDGGSIEITARTALLQEGATIAVGSLGRGVGGSIAVQAHRLSLDTHAALTAETASTQGGNITLDVRDLLLLRYNSLISTTAGTGQSGGNGGNITINTARGFIVGVLAEDSDIRANAFSGNGGKVDITTQGIFGLQFQLKNTSNSDVTASSQFGGNGTVRINIIQIDPSSGLVELPIALADPSQQIATGCNPQGSSFVVTGRGGVPPNPRQQVSSDRPWSDLRPLARLTQSSTVTPFSQLQRPVPLLEASTWRTQADGTLELIAAPVALLALPPAQATCALSYSVSSWAKRL